MHHNNLSVGERCRKSILAVFGVVEDECPILKICLRLGSVVVIGVGERYLNLLRVQPYEGVEPAQSLSRKDAILGGVFEV